MHTASHMSVITYLILRAIQAIHGINALIQIIWQRVGKFLLKSIITLLNGSKIALAESIYLIWSKVLGLSLTCNECYLDIGTMTIDSVPHHINCHVYMFYTCLIHKLTRLNSCLFQKQKLSEWTHKAIHLVIVFALNRLCQASSCLDIINTIVVKLMSLIHKSVRVPLWEPQWFSCFPKRWSRCSESTLGRGMLGDFSVE